MAGEAEIPNLNPTHDVKRYGARGDGRTDDSRAFQRAIDDMEDGDVLRVPAGRCAQFPLPGCTPQMALHAMTMCASALFAVSAGT
jgi:hypothetical protein